MRVFRFDRVLAGSLLLPLVACGGGGGGGNDAGLPPSFFETSEYDANFGLGAIGASSAYGEGATGSGIKVAVIDTGIDIDHPEFRGAIDPASTDVIGAIPDVDDADGHGTAVAGVIGARRNGELTHGVAFNASLLAIQAARSCGDGCLFDQRDVATATDYAVDRGARVINYSLGGPTVLAPELESALARAVDAGVVLVFAAGNDGASRPTLPARFAGGGRADGRAIAVGAVDREGRIASFSNRAGETEEAFLVAPGVAVAAPRRGGGQASFTGTSFATPHVTGSVAVVLEAAPFLSADEVVQLLLDTARDLGEPGVDATYGYGLVDLDAALAPQGQLGIPLGRSAAGPQAPLASSGLTFGPAFGAAPSLGEAIFLDRLGRPYRLDLDRHVETAAGRGRPLAWIAPGGHMRQVALLDRSGAGLRLELAEAAAAVGAEQPPDGAPAAGFVLSAGFGSRAEIMVTHDWQVDRLFGLANLDPGVAAMSLTARTRSPYLALADGGEALIVASEIAPGLALRAGLAAAKPADAGIERGARNVAVAELVQTWGNGTALGLQAGSLAEDASLLDTAGGGAMAVGGGETTFFGLTTRLPILGSPGRGSHVSFFGHAHYGLTRAAGTGPSLIQEISTLHSTAFTAGLAARHLVRAGDRLTLSVAQPIRVDAGRATVDLPVARAFDGTIARERRRVDLAPQGRELDVELAYRLPLAADQHLTIGWSSRIEPDHDREQGPAHALGFKWRSRF